MSNKSLHSFRFFHGGLIIYLFNFFSKTAVYSVLSYTFFLKKHTRLYYWSVDSPRTGGGGGAQTPRAIPILMQFYCINFSGTQYNEILNLNAIVICDAIEPF